IDAKNQWLGNPNRSGAYIADKGRGHCDSCFEDTYELLWTPAFQPIRGHWWLLRSLAAGDDWQQAQAVPPWRGYTTLDINLAANYPRARIDWWGLVWLKHACHPTATGLPVADCADATATWPLGLALLVLFAGSTAAGSALWLRRH